MGAGNWNATVYSSTTGAKVASNQTFQYSNNMKQSLPTSSWKTHEDLDPKDVTVRESRDSEEHPTTHAVAVLCDVTGSMYKVPQIIQQTLPNLMGIITRNSYLPDPQIMIGGIGDANTDAVPLQISQFETDNRVDDNLDHLFLEGNGGGQGMESYELAMWFMANRVSMDCYEKRQHKGYLFIIGDEKCYSHVFREQIEKYIGGPLPEADVPLAQVVTQVKEMYHLYFILPNMTMYYTNGSHRQHWEEIVGEDHMIYLEHPSLVAEVIAATIGANEGLALQDIEQHLGDAGVDLELANKVTTTVSKIANASTVAAKVDGNIPNTTSASAAERL